MLVYSYFYLGIEVPISSQTPKLDQRRLVVTVTLPNLTTLNEGVLEIFAHNTLGNISFNTSVIVVGMQSSRSWFQLALRRGAFLFNEKLTPLVFRQANGQESTREKVDESVDLAQHYMSSNLQTIEISDRCVCAPGSTPKQIIYRSRFQDRNNLAVCFKVAWGMCWAKYLVLAGPTSSNWPRRVLQWTPNGT